MVHNLAADARGFTSNAFLVEGDRPALVDVGNDFDVVSAVRERVPGLDVVALTHAHPDHVGNLAAVREAFEAPVLGFDPAVDVVERAVEDGEAVTLGDHEYVALHTPGHADDHLCFYAREPGVLFAGDLVFSGGGFGRTDLDGGDRATLVASLERLLDAVDGDLEALHPGHGPSVAGGAYGAIQLAGRASGL